ncbi:THUMP domain-containing class I SAM-dependent RNA methyltransferase [Dyadobacter sandarakinus]|uniref:Class I SAM-dependent RNA methyltransferase n=1 Tax=Dyadobacter sandarakinus TaxID=2747268 RepID=A0ABX7I2D8_9BACT|nr:class I SAM-dependent RNA methyltransferase [Dyadobacter sandarakinus]QRQ99949.1 class I SAM-dependent RNA methyltransferase [Dyadobacter sandarakinus]
MAFDIRGTSPITITCYRRLAPFLEAEVKSLGYTPESTFATGLRLRGTIQDCVRLNLHLYTASQVLFSLGAFTARHADDVYRYLMQLEWEKILPADGYFSVTSTVQTPSVNNNMFVNVRVKDAVADRFREKTGARPSSGAALTGAVIHLHWKNEDAEVFLDTSGETLARHGYRKIPGQAPMLEALASATILASKWNKASAFINPMCGSGTLAIEAALMASNAKPGLFRTNYGFMHLLGYDEDFYFAQQDKLEEQMIEPTIRIIASDNNANAIENARRNAKAAGVLESIDFETCDFSETTIPAEHKGAIFLNPEYGERLGEVQELEETYSRIGDFMKQKCGGYYGYVFTGNLDLAKKIGLKASRRTEFYNGTIDCRLLEYELYEGSRRI